MKKYLGKLTHLEKLVIRVRKILLSFLFIILSVGAYEAPKKTKFEALCEQAEAILAVIQSMPNLLPHAGLEIKGPVVTPVVTFFAAMENDGAMMMVCNVVMKARELKNAELRAFAAEQFNHITGKKFDDEINLFLKANSISQTTGRHSLNPSDPEFFKTANTINQTTDLLLDAQSYYNENYNPGQKTEDKIFSTVYEREARVNELASVAYNMNSLKKEISCPDDNQRELFNQDYNEYYSKIVEPKKNSIVVAKDRQTELRYHLVDMGKEMYAQDIKKFKKYISTLNSLSNNSFSYKTKMKVRKRKSESAPGKMGFVNKEYQRVSVNADRSQLNKFLELYNEEWTAFLNRIRYTNTYGLASGTLIEQQTDSYQTFNPDCNYSKIEDDHYNKGNLDKFGYDENARNQFIEREYQKCVSDSKIDPYDILNATANEYYKQMKIERDNQAGVWTQESFHYGRKRHFSDSSSKTFASQEVSCSNSMNKSEMKLLNNQLVAQEVHLKSILASEYTKRVISKRRALQAEKKNEQERDLRRKLERREKEVEIENESLIIPQIPSAPKTF
jgi:hypothetical protein